MQMNEVVKKVDLSKRAVKYYEEQGLLEVAKDLDGNNKDLLEQIFQEKAKELDLQKAELEALGKFIHQTDVNDAYQVVDYKTIGDAMKEMFSGFYGYYFMNHFMPYLQIQIETPVQEQAYRNIIEFWDNTDIRLPFMKELQDKGYNDIFIPNMKVLSPKYKEYHDALMRANDRVCADLGLYYDSNYNLVMKER